DSGKKILLSRLDEVQRRVKEICSNKSGQRFPVLEESAKNNPAKEDLFQKPDGDAGKNGFETPLHGFAEREPEKRLIGCVHPQEKAQHHNRAGSEAQADPDVA